MHGKHSYSICLLFQHYMPLQWALVKNMLMMEPLDWKRSNSGYCQNLDSVNALTCNEHLWLIEWELQYVQANNAFNKVQCSIQLHAHLTIFKATNIRDQCANTGTCTALDYVAKKWSQVKAKYTTAWQALLVLSPSLKKSGWEDQLWPLRHSDMRHMTNMLDGQMKGTRDLSWIWKVPDIIWMNDNNLQDCKSMLSDSWLLTCNLISFES